MISIIAAVDSNGVIGKDGNMPWHNKEDLRWFKRITMGHCLVMGRKTYDAVGALSGRRSLVLSRNPEFAEDHPDICIDSIEKCIEFCKQQDQIFVAGGASIYEQFLPYADELIITRIPGEHEGDTYFPLWPISTPWDRTNTFLIYPPSSRMDSQRIVVNFFSRG